MVDCKDQTVKDQIDKIEAWLSKLIFGERARMCALISLPLFSFFFFFWLLPSVFQPQSA